MIDKYNSDASFYLSAVIWKTYNCTSLSSKIKRFLPIMATRSNSDDLSLLYKFLKGILWILRNMFLSIKHSTGTWLSTQNLFKEMSVLYTTLAGQSQVSAGFNMFVVNYPNSLGFFFCCCCCCLGFFVLFCLFFYFSKICSVFIFHRTWKISH